MGSCPYQGPSLGLLSCWQPRGAPGLEAAQDPGVPKHGMSSYMHMLGMCITGIEPPNCPIVHEHVFLFDFE